MLRPAVFAGLALAGLAACEAPSAPDYFGVDTPIPTSRAAGFFMSVCLNNSASLENARQTLGGLPVVRNSGDDIYYHTDFLISFKITPVNRRESVCSMVWDPIEPNRQSMATLEAVAPNAILRDNQDGTITAFHYANP